MTKRSLLLLALASAACSQGHNLARAPRGEELLVIEGAVKKGPYRLSRTDLEGLPRAQFRAVDPATGQEGSYGGTSLLALVLEELPLEPAADTLVLRTAGKVAVPVGFGLLRQYRPILADRLDGQAIPLRLVWPNVEQRGLDRDPRADLWWAGPVRIMEVMSWQNGWGRLLRAPPGSSDAARRGSGQYVARCAGCHRLAGAGGEAGPDLAGAASRLGAAEFLVRLRRHPSWRDRVGVELAPGADVAREIHAFLATVDLAGTPPPEEPSPAGESAR